jgi:hypothetical protein
VNQEAAFITHIATASIPLQSADVAKLGLARHLQRLVLLQVAGQKKADLIAAGFNSTTDSSARFAKFHSTPNFAATLHTSDNLDLEYMRLMRSLF